LHPEPLILAGFLVTRPAPRPDTAAAIVPEVVITGSDCIAPMAPSTWTLAWVTNTRDERLACLGAFGLGDALLDDVVARSTAKFGAGLGWPHMFTDLETAREFLRRFVPRDHDARLLALCLSAADGARFVANSGAASSSEPAVLATLRSGRAPPPGGTALGSDLLGLEAGGSFHSFLCNGLEAEVHARCGVVPNTWGLYDDHDVARRSAAAIEEVGTAEPGPWFAWRMLDYAREEGADSTSKASA
jgi:hypothetical protein